MRNIKTDCPIDLQKIAVNLLLMAVVLFAVVIVIMPENAMAKPGDKIKFEGKVVGKWGPKGEKILTKVYPASKAYKNKEILNKWLSGNKKKTIILPKKTIHLSNALTPGSNSTIIAKGTTLKFAKGTRALYTIPKTTGYSSVENLRIIGGKWYSKDVGGRQGSLIVLVLSKNIVIDGITTNASYTGHALEIIACKNVVVKNSIIIAKGTTPEISGDEQVQIDLCTADTAPKIPKKYRKGQTCQDIYILNNTIKGSRGVSSNWAKQDPASHNKYHKNVTIEGNKIEATSSQPIVLANTMGQIKIINNTVKAFGSRITSSATVGVNITLYGNPSTLLEVTDILIEGNTIYGGREGIFIKPFPMSGTSQRKFGSGTIKGNTVYAKQGRDRAIYQVERYIERLTMSPTDNFTAGW